MSSPGLFSVIPKNFFNYLASGSNAEVYSACLLEIYHEYDREISYRLPRERIRDTVRAYLLENHVDLEEEGESPDKTAEASSVLRKFMDSNVGWLEEESDENTFEKQIVMTENGVRLAEFLLQLMKPEKAEFSAYIFNIYNLFQNPGQWQDEPYVNALRPIYQNAKNLSGALKRLSTYIRKIIEKMVREETLESLTENLLQYCEGEFIREYARLNKQQNIHIYRRKILEGLSDFWYQSEIRDKLIENCSAEEQLDREASEDQISFMIESAVRFLSDDYDAILREIRHKLNVYLQVAVGRARFLKNQGGDSRGNVEQVLRIITAGMKECGIREELPDGCSGLFALETNEFLDRGSLRYPRKQRAIRTVTKEAFLELSPEDRERALQELQRERYNPYSKDRMQDYLKSQMEGKTTIHSDELPLESVSDLLSVLSSAAYADELGYGVEVSDGYYETEHLILREFTIRKGDLFT